MSQQTSSLPVPASPTGVPIIPPKAVPYVLLGGAALTVVSEEVANPGPWSLGRILALIVKLLPLAVGGASPGLRR